MKIKWTPWFNVAMHRRLEVLSVTFAVIVFMTIYAISIPVLIYLLIAGNIYWKIGCTLYLAFYVYDIKTLDRAGVDWLRNLSVWKNVRNYFPIDLVKTADLTPDRNYLICHFPHGFFSVSVTCNFCIGGSKWPALFPGIRPKVATLNLCRFIPLARELFLNIGCISASANSLTTLLNRSNNKNHKSNRDGFTSNAVVLVVGGIREQQDCTYPNRYRFVLKNRRGFVRIALQSGASLVPSISFGENDYYDMIEHKPYAWMQRIFKIQNWPMFFFGRGYLQYNFGLIPKRRPITTVIGAPIHLKKNLIPSQDEINGVHELFCTRLVQLFEEHKAKYVKNFEHVHLEFV